MKSILITGHKGTIGSILMDELSEEFDLKGCDFPEIDLTDYNSVLSALENCYMVIHLAWNGTSENMQNWEYDQNNSLLFYNIFKGAVEKGIKRVIMASSVHVCDLYNHSTSTDNSLITVGHYSGPARPYGANKLFMEALGKMTSQLGPEVICIRFGGINKEDRIYPDDIVENKIWLSKNDCCRLIKSCILAEAVPNKFTIIHAISNNTGKLHDVSNPFNWEPVDDAFKIIAARALL